MIDTSKLASKIGAFLVESSPTIRKDLEPKLKV